MSVSIADVLERAADEMERRGFTKGEWEDDNGCVCVEGALRYGGAAERFAGVDISPAGRFFERLVGGDMVHWNDAPERTQAEVVSALRQAAAKARLTEGER